MNSLVMKLTLYCPHYENNVKLSGLSDVNILLAAN